MSIWEYLACLDGWNAAHGGKDQAEAAPMSADRARALGIEGL